MKKDKPKILYVDDEVNNLTGFKASFRRDYQVMTAQSALDAQEILKENEFSVIISDERMPGMTGVEFFRSIIDEYPRPVRMLLTGYADIDSVIKAINEGHVYQYISKPWVEEDLKMTIDRAVNYYTTQNELSHRNQELETFVYSASHDLRAPLASVLGIVKLAKMEGPDADYPDYMNKIEANINKLDLLLQNIIAYHRNNQLKAEAELINFELLIQEALESFEFYEHANTIDFQVDINQASPYTGDKSRIQIILNNLISNAIKFQRKDESNKKVEIKAEISEEMARIRIADNGVGISEQELEKVFTMFYRSTTSSSGSGIGLYIVKETLDKLSGNLKVTSNEGQGTEFIIQIPRGI